MQQDRLSITEELHREAGKRGYSCMPKLSSIDRRWFAEIDRYVGSPGIMEYNIALGVGDTPLEAAADGYTKVMPDDMQITVLAITARIDVVIQAIGKEMRLVETAMSILTSTLRSYNVPVRPSGPMLTPGEDDDL